MILKNISPANYYDHDAVSNSDLTWLKHMFDPPQIWGDIQVAFKFGRLIDYLITEPETVDYYRLRAGGETFDKADFIKAIEMRKSFMKDPFCRKMLQNSIGQMIFCRNMEIESGIKFSLPVRCKYDLWSTVAGWGADVKSTTATSQREFEEACLHFDYFRSRAWYMDISGAKTDVLFGISKKNFKIFHLTIQKGDKNYNLGKEQYEELALRWYLLFENLNPTKNQLLCQEQHAI